MSDWGSGYVTDVEYGAAFHRDQSPSMLRLACLLFGIEPAIADDGFTYCELGCGKGMTSLILAASNPAGRFVGVDFNPGHILHARAAAQAAGLTNVDFLECGFEELTGGGPALPQFDLVTMHGVYSWVRRDVRDAIVRFLAAHLKPGGIAYVNYNAMPGWAVCIPVQRLLYDLAALGWERSDAKVMRAVGVLQQLQEAEAAALTDNVFVKEILSTAKLSQQKYLAHEYLNDHWTPLYHADVARELAAAKLEYAGSADILANFPEFMLTLAQREILDRPEHAPLRETLIDFCVGRRFRQDIYVRGRRPLSPARQQALLRQLTLALVVPRSEFQLKLKAATGVANLPPEIYEPIADALAERPRTVEELLRLVKAQVNREINPGEIVAMLVGSAQALPLQPQTRPEDQAPADRLNRTLLDRIEELEVNSRAGLAVASLGTALYCTFPEMLVYRGLLSGAADPIEQAAAEAQRIIVARGDRLLKDGKPVDDAGTELDALRQTVRKITEKSVPLWQKLLPAAHPR